LVVPTASKVWPTGGRTAIRQLLTADEHGLPTFPLTIELTG
jgi:hypothetical protein